MSTRPWNDSRYKRQFIVGSLLFPLLLAGGCDRAPKTDGQTIATVNGEAITNSDLQLELANIPPNRRKELQPLAVQSLVQRKILAQFAKESKVDRSPDYILQARRMEEALLAQRATQKIAASARQPVTTAAVNEYLDRHPELSSQRKLFLVNQLQFPTPSQEVIASLKPAKTEQELATLLSQHGIVARRSQATMDTAELSDRANKKMASLPPGEPLVVLEGQRAIASTVVSERVVPLSGEESEQIARNRMEGERSSAALRQRADMLRKQAEITYAKGYAPPSPARASK